MTYTQLLNQIIEESGLSANEVVRRCKAIGVTFSPQHLSRLRNNPRLRAKDYISRAIAKVCGKPEDWLVTQARLDEETEELAESRAIIRKCIKSVVKLIAMAPGYEEIGAAVDLYIDNLSDIELIHEINSMDLSMFSFDDENMQQDSKMNALSKQLYSLALFTVEDDAMYPILRKGSQVRIEACDAYKDGDMLCYQKWGDDARYIRQAQFLDTAHSKVKMIPINYGYNSDTFESNEIVILGKVKQAITNFE
ncbi:MAG TPA: hypothetical protein GX499_04395 [Clostridiales bacterium]|jgi:hypothetical protein|nr:hypothetical protein [Clostridiales bacterium]